MNVLDGSGPPATAAVLAANELPLYDAVLAPWTVNVVVV